MLTLEILTNSIAQFFSHQLASRLDNGSLAVYPMRLDRIQPRAFDGQPQNEDAHPAFSLHSLIMPFAPLTHFPALVPGGIVPDQHQHPLAFCSQLPRDPFQEVGGDLADGPSLYKSQQQLVGVASEQPVTAQRLRLRLGFALVKLMKFQRLRIRPRMKLRLMQPTPPRLLFIAQNPIAVRCGQPLQPLQWLFFKAYCGSGLLIQFLARFHCTPRRRIARRITSRLTGVLTSPCSKATSAAKSKVQRLVGLPNWRGGECSRAFSRWHLSSSRTGFTVFGRRDFSSTEARPQAWKSRITLRTVWVAQPKARAI